MNDMLVIVSKAVFGKVRNATGRPLEIGDTYEVDRYISKNKSIAKKLTGDLYMITVQDGALLWVGHLKAPKHDGDAWISEENTQPIIDITDLASKFKFTTGKGVNVEKMAMSLQTPRVLTEEDIALFPESQSQTPVVKSSIDIDGVVRRVAAYIMEISEDEVDADKRRWAAFQWEDMFLEEYLEAFNFETLELEVEVNEKYPQQDIYGRTDIDLSRSIFNAGSFLESETTDVSLKRLFARQNGGIYLTQLAELIAAKRFDLESLDFTMCFSRVEAKSEGLIDTLRGLLLLNNFEKFSLAKTEYYELDSEHEAFLNTIEPPSLRDHIGLFFQDADSARCTGAALYSGESTVFDLDGIQCYDHVVSWWVGEGQGEISLMEIVNDEVPEVPKFDGLTAIRYEPPMPDARNKPCESGTTLDLLQKDLGDYLTEFGKHKFFADLSVAKRIEGRDARSFLAGVALASGDPFPRLLENPNRAARSEVATLLTSLPFVERPISSRYKWELSKRLLVLECYDEAAIYLDELLEDENLLTDIGIPVEVVQICRAEVSLKKGDFGSAKAFATAALKTNGDAHQATGILGVAKVGLEDETGYSEIESCMKAKVDPDPPQHIAESSLYLELAAIYAIPVRIF